MRKYFLVLKELWNFRSFWIFVVRDARGDTDFWAFVNEGFRGCGGSVGV
jgi:hypothetical protein